MAIRITIWLHGLFFFGIRHYWEIRKVVSTDCGARRCSARHSLACIVIATVTSLRHRPTTDSGTDIATLVRRSMAEVCTVPVLLVYSLCLPFVTVFYVTAAAL